MWQIYPGHPFILQGFEAKFYLELIYGFLNLFLEAADENLEASDCDVSTGCIILDNATVKQKVYLISFCLSALLDPNIPPPQLTHILEATVYLPFAYLQEEIEKEIENQEYIMKQENDRQNYWEDYFSLFYYRRMADQAYRQLILPLNIALDITHSQDLEMETVEEFQQYYQEILSFSYESTDLQEWTDRITSLAHHSVLGDDEDFQITSIAPQLVDGATDVALNMGITDEYLSNKLPNVSDEEYEEALKVIYKYYDQICRSILWNNAYFCIFVNPVQHQLRKHTFFLSSFEVTSTESNGDG
jgi:hypothetical protein